MADRAREPILDRLEAGYGDIQLGDSTNLILEDKMRKTPTVFAALIAVLLPAIAHADDCPVLPGWVGAINANSLRMDVGDGYHPLADITDLSIGNDIWHWNGRWYKIEENGIRNPDFNSVRFSIDPSSRMLTVRLETSPLREMTVPASFLPGEGFTYVQARVADRIAVCVKLPGFPLR
jgi:hypothetical protein